MKNKVKSTFRSSLIVGLIPLSVILIIIGFIFWGFSAQKAKKETENVVDKTEVVHDTVYVKVPCNKNHFDCTTVEPRKRKVADVPTQVEPVLNTTNQDTSN